MADAFMAKVMQLQDLYDWVCTQSTEDVRQVLLRDFETAACLARGELVDYQSGLDALIRLIGAADSVGLEASSMLLLKIYRHCGGNMYHVSVSPTEQ